ncbi:MAG TPA: YfhO family protein [Chloroflexia bacterium]|nr:YfhO family protein [Chloroflexia bacterium]
MLANRSVLACALALLVALAAAYALTRWLYGRRWAKQEQHDGRERRYHRDVAATGLLLALVAGFFWRPLFNSGVTMPNGGGDLVSFFYPIHVFASESLRTGQIPLWNPYLFSGMPFAADIQSGLFYPLNWIFWLLGRPVTYEKVEMLALVHYWLAAAFAYALARSLNLGRWPALLAGILYAFSGFAVSHLGHLPMLAAATWFPLVLLAVNQAARPRPDYGRAAGWRWAIAAGLFLAISLLAGHFQLFLYNFYGAAIFWIAVAWRGRSYALAPESGASLLRRTWQNYWTGQALRAALAGAVMLGATLVQLWPFYEMGQLSIRSSISYDVSTQFGVWPVGLADLLLPNLFSPNPKAYFGYWSNTDVLGYMGLFSFALAGLGVLLRSGQRRAFYPVFFLSLGLAGLLFSLSGYTIFQGWFYQFVPALNLTRGSGRFLYWFNLGFGLAAAFGLQNWLEYRSQPRSAEGEQLLKWGWRSLALAALVLIIVPLPLLFSQMLSTPGNINDLVVRGINGLVMDVIVLGLGAGLLRLYYRRTPGPDLGAFLAVALLVFDLFSARAGFNPVAADVANGFYHDGTASFIRSQDPAGQYRLEASVGSVQQAWQANTAQIYGLHDVRGVFNPLQLADYETLWNAVTSAQKDFRAVPAYNLFGAKYVLARSKEDPTGSQFKQVYRDQRPGVNIDVWENSVALPRAWVVHQAALKGHAETIPALVSPDFKPAEELYLESGRTLNGPAGAQPGEAVTLVSQSLNSLQIEANLASDGYIVINQAYYPGWKARVDGQSASYERADYAFGAVYLPAGKHSLSLEFAPASIAIGGIVSLLTWVLALGALAWPLLFRRKRRV